LSKSQEEKGIAAIFGFCCSAYFALS